MYHVTKIRLKRIIEKKRESEKKRGKNKIIIIIKMGRGGGGGKIRKIGGRGKRAKERKYFAYSSLIYVTLMKDF